MNPSTPNLNTPQWTRKLLILTLVMSLALIVWSLGSYLWDKYRVVLDVQNFYWMARAQDPTLFATDYLYLAGSRIIAVDIWGFHLLLYLFSLGYGLFFYLASTVIDYIWLTKWSILILGPFCVIYLFKTGQFLRDNLTGMSLSLIFMFFILASPRSLSIASGLQRAFAMPILIIFMYYLIRQRYVKTAVSILASALIYLPIFPPIVVTYALSFLKVERPFKLSLSLNRAKLIPFIVTLLLSGVFVALALASKLELLSSRLPQFPAAAQKLPDFAEGPLFNQANGPVPLFSNFPLLGRAGIFATGGDAINGLVILILASLIYKIIGRQSLRRIPVTLWYFLIAGFIMYVVSLFVIVDLSSSVLYLPSRYAQNTLFLTGVFFVGLNWTDFLNKFPDWLWRNRRLVIFCFVSFGLMLATGYILSSNRMMFMPIFWLMGLMLSGILALLGGSSMFWLGTKYLSQNNVAKWGSLLALGIIVVYLGTIYISTLGIKPTNPSEAERKIYEFVTSLPKDAMFAGDPDIMTNIPIFSKRGVLLRGLFPKTNAPFLEYFDAQYAEAPETILNFCQRYQVDYLVIDIGDLAPNYLAKGQFFFQPWNDEIIKMVADRSNFIVPQLQPVFTSGPYRVIKCDAETLLASNEPK